MTQMMKFALCSQKKNSKLQEMSSVLSSAGATSVLGEQYIVVTRSTGFKICSFKQFRNRIDSGGQEVTLSHPFNIVWSENSAHLVVITTNLVFLYECPSSCTVAGQVTWTWRLQRSVDAPRNLLAFQAGYSHPLLSLEQNNVTNVENTAGVGDVVVINLLCSLFQTFSVANPTFQGTQYNYHAPVNQLSHSGRYLLTAQSFTNPNTNTASMGLRVYDLLDLWVLERPAEVSYLDFKYADLGLENALSKAHTSHNDHQSSLCWDVEQIVWKQSNLTSMAEDANELFFITQRISHSKQQDITNVRNSTRAHSIGIAGRQSDYETAFDSTKELFNSAPNSPYTPIDSKHTTTSIVYDVSVSIYSVSQQPDYENINILTMAYQAAIVAGQLNHDDYNNNTTHTTLPTMDTQNVAHTTTINLLVVVTLDALCREISSSVNYSIDGYKGTARDRVLFAWIEEPATSTTAGLTTSSTHKHKNSNVALWLSAVFSCSTNSNDTVRSNSTTQYKALICGLHYQDRANSCNDQKMYSYSPCFVRSSDVCFSTMTPFCVLTSLRSSGNMHALSNGASAASKNSTRTCVDFYTLHDQIHDTGTSGLFSVLTLSVDPAVGSTNTELLLTDYSSFILPTCYDAEDTQSDDMASTNSRAIASSLLPSANVAFIPVGCKAGLLEVRLHNKNEGGHTVRLFDFNDSTVSGIESIVTASIVSDATTNIGNLCILYRKSDLSLHIGVWSMSSNTNTQHYLNQHHAVYNQQYYSSLPAVHYAAPTVAQPSTPHNVSTLSYNTTIQPDPHFGLGIRIDVVNNKTVVSSFKRHPITNKAMNAQLTGDIQIGDEFLAINGKPLCALPLSDVIHIIRTTVSEGGDNPVDLSMRRSGTTSATNAITNGMNSTGVQSATGNASGKGSGAVINPYASQVTSIREVTSISSMTSFLSTNSLSDGLDRHTDKDKSMDRVDTTNDLNTDNNYLDTSGTNVVVPLCNMWAFQSTIALSEQALTADLLVNDTTESDTNNGTKDVCVVALEKQDTTKYSVALYKVSLSNTQQSQITMIVSMDLLSRERYESVYPINTSNGFIIQLWNMANKQENHMLSITVLEQQGRTSDASTPIALTSEPLPVLTMYTALSEKESGWILKSSALYNCVPVTDTILSLKVNSISAQSPKSLLLLPDASLFTTLMKFNSITIAVQLRTYTSTAAHIPLYINRDSVVDCSITPIQTGDNCGVYRHIKDTVNILELFALLLNTLTEQTSSGIAKSDTSKDKIFSWLSEVVGQVCSCVTQDRQLEVQELVDAVHAHYKCSPCADILLNKLRQYLSVINNASNNSNNSGTILDLKQLGPYVNRALKLLVVLHDASNSTSSITSTSNMNNSTAGDSTTSKAITFQLAGCVVANLLFAEQERLLALLIPPPSGTNGADSSSDESNGNLTRTIHSLLREDSGIVSSPIKANPDSFTTTNNYINFTATTDTSAISSSTIDILAYLTSIHAALWMHDVTPLLDVIYKHAMASFRKHKSSIQVFLEMVLVGKEDTLLQLAKTDREKSGKQLLSLLTLHDNYSSDKSRRTLHKNAFALMKLHRYRDAAAVFLLAQPPYLKEACSVLSRQYNNPYFALLVSRLVEMRCASSTAGTASTGANPGASINTTDSFSPRSAPVATSFDLSGAKNSTSTVSTTLLGVEGYILGPVSRQVVSNDILPMLISAVENSSVRTVQHNKLYPNSGASGDNQGSNSITGFNAAVLALVCALWLQDRKVLKSTLHQVLHKYTLVDNCAALTAEHSTDGAAASEALSILGSIDWLLEVGAYLGAKHYAFVLESVQTFLAHCHMHQALLNTALYNTPAVRKLFVQQVRTNPFWRYNTLCHTQYEDFMKNSAEQKKSEENEAQAATIDLFGSIVSPIVTNGTSNSDNFTLEPMADSPGAVQGENIFFGQPSPAIPKSNGFNFASMGKSSRPTSVNITSGANTPILSPLSAPATDIFGSFDLPPPARHTRASSRSSTVGGVGISDTTQSAISTPKTLAAAVDMGNRDMLDSAFNFAPPTRPTRVAAPLVPTVPTLETGELSSNMSAAAEATEVPAVLEVPSRPKFSFASTPSPSPSQSSTNQAATTSIFDSSFDFAPPARHTRASRPTSTTGALSPVLSPELPILLFTATETDESKLTNVKSSFNFASSKATVAAEETGRVTVPVVRSALDDFDFFAPPPRASRRVNSSSTENNDK